MIRFYQSLFFSRRFFIVTGAFVLLYLLGYLLGKFIGLINLLFFAFIALSLVDLLILYVPGKSLSAKRLVPKKLSNGDNNEIRLFVFNNYPFKIFLYLLEELPFQFQERNMSFKLSLKPNEERTLKYTVRPVKRGEYTFGAVNAFANTPLNLINRRYKFDEDKMVPVYPSFLQMRKYELLAISNRLSEVGIKKIRRIGHSFEFEQINEYVRGDDYRSINWNATARHNHLMVNQYQDERSQNLYCIIDKGRTMKMPFNGMTLLDYAINSTLVLSNIAIKRHDKAGLVTFSDKISHFVPPDNRAMQMFRIQETLYNQRTLYNESDYSKLYITLKRKINQRSLLILYTNFETGNSVKRQLDGFLRLAQQHLLVVVFFENRELNEKAEVSTSSLKGIYQKTIAAKFSFEKQEIIRELKNKGIYTILTYPENLTANTLNKYLELKARGLF